MRAALILGLAALVSLDAETAHAKPKDPTAVGKAHAKKANNLAAAGKCKAAIPEFTRAYAILKDPALLFNRAECWRKVGQPARALTDYRQFLAQLPEAPNRALVEQRIGELDPSAAPPPPPVVEEKPPTPSPPPPPVEEKPAPPPAVVEKPPAPARRQLPDMETPPALQVTARKDEPPSSGVPAWVWIGAGVLVVGAGAAGWYVFGRNQTDVPSSSLGNFKF